MGTPCAAQGQSSPRRARAVFKRGFATQLGEAKGWLVDEAAKSGVKIGGYRHTITDDFVRHVKKEHGDARREDARGNVAVTDKDFGLLKDVVENPDFLAVGAKDKNGRDIIAYAQKLDNGTAVYFEEVLSSAKKRLNGKTFYKKKKHLTKETFTNILT